MGHSLGESLHAGACIHRYIASRASRSQRRTGNISPLLPECATFVSEAKSGTEVLLYNKSLE
jgi:hypothetical protein